MSIQVFISHSHEDNDLCEQVIQALQQWGVRFWFDRKDLRGGSVLSETIEKAIAESRYFLRVCSPAATKSDYMRREAEYFIELRDAERKVSPEATSRQLIPLIVAEPYSPGLLDADTLRILAVSRPRSAWLNELRTALDVPAAPPQPTPPRPAASDGDRRHRSNAHDDGYTPPKSPAVVAMLREMDTAIAHELNEVEKRTVGPPSH